MDQASEGGRVNQKARTRAALLESAILLIREGRRPTVEEAALAVGISKRTAYRYFISQDHLLADAALESLRSGVEDMLAATSAAGDVHARIAALAVAMSRLAQQHDAELRVMIRASLDQNAGGGSGSGRPPRGRRRLDWIEMALAPARDRFAPDAYERLVRSLAVCLGIDALIVLRDICGVTGQAAEDTMIWAATAVLDRALAEAEAG